MEFVWRSLAHVYKNYDSYMFITERTYREFLSGDDLVEFDKDFAEIDAFEANLFDQGKLVLIETLYEDIPFPDGTTANPNGNDQQSGYYIKFIADGPDEPNDLIHPHYFKWFEKIKTDSNIVTIRESNWVK